MSKFVFCAISFSIFLSASGPANAAVQLYVWKPYSSGPGLIIAARESESPDHAAKRYIEALNSDAGLKDLSGRAALENLPLRNFKPLTHEDFARRVLVIANNPKQMQPFHADTLELTSPFRNNGATPYILPVAADARMESDSDQIIDLLDTFFPSFLAIGGADLDRRVWGERNELSINPNLRRDLFEARLIRKKLATINVKAKTWVPTGSGIFVRQDRLAGVCRGAQLTAKEMGHHVGNDIACEIPWAIKHGTGQEGCLADHAERDHPADVLTTTNSLTKTFLNDAGQVIINSRHHQYIVLLKSARFPLEATMLSSRDGIGEGFESPDGSIILFQWHPEAMQNRPIGALMMARLSQFLTPMRTCPQILSVVPM